MQKMDVCVSLQNAAAVRHCVVVSCIKQAVIFIKANEFPRIPGDII